MPRDRALRRSVLTELIWEPGIDTAHIGVTADRGIVVLSGHVENYLQQRNVEEATIRVRGVHVVIDELKVRLPLSLDRGDEGTEQAALKRPDWESDSPKNGMMLRDDINRVTRADGGSSPRGPTVSTLAERYAVSPSVCTLSGDDKDEDENTLVVA